MKNTGATAGYTLRREEKEALEYVNQKEAPAGEAHSKNEVRHKRKCENVEKCLALPVFFRNLRTDFSSQSELIGEHNAPWIIYWARPLAQSSSPAQYCHRTVGLILDWLNPRH